MPAAPSPCAGISGRTYASSCPVSQWRISTLHLKQQPVECPKGRSMASSPRYAPCDNAALFGSNHQASLVLKHTFRGLQSGQEGRLGGGAWFQVPYLKWCKTTERRFTCSNRHSRSSRSLFNLTSEEIRKTHR